MKKYLLGMLFAASVGMGIIIAIDYNGDTEQVQTSRDKDDTKNPNNGGSEEPDDDEA